MVWINKLLLETASPVFRKRFYPAESLAKFGKLKETPHFIKEFLEKGAIQETSHQLISPGHINELMEFAQKWEIPSLQSYAVQLALSKDFVKCLTVDTSNFNAFFDYALETKSIKLFEKCVQFKFGKDSKIHVEDFDQIKIVNDYYYNQGLLDEFCSFLVDLHKTDPRFPVIKRFKISGDIYEKGEWGFSKSDVKYTDCVTEVDLTQSQESIFLSPISSNKESDPYSPKNFKMHQLLDFLNNALSCSL
ncbi:MAG: hypothetical protein HWD61_12220 [Parachlamydiaceae bacterium]|nr:MAG: hypothetical protein HWD61_12220 [Parachlamydiaceae bacterium]